jgi:hypothetical protein
MPINMQQLAAALEPVRKIGTEEITFPVGDTEITLSLATPKQEVEAHEYARAALSDDDEEERHAVMSYLDHIKVGFLSYAIVKMGDMDLHGEDRIATGEILDNEKEVTVPKHVAMRDLLWTWNRLVLVGMFRKYAELLSKTQEAVEEAIEFEPSDTEAEIERLNERITELQRIQKEQTHDAEVTNHTLRLAEVDGTEVSPDMVAASPGDTPAPEPPPSPPEPSEAQETAPVAPPQERASILPTEMPPPAEAPPSHSQPPGQQEPVPAQAPRRPPPTPDSSFVDTSDTDSMQAAVAAEHHRIAARRDRVDQGLPPDDVPESALSMLSSMQRTPPHLGAAQVASTLTAAELKHQALERQEAEAIGTTAEGVPVFRLPTEGIGAPDPTAPEPVQVNPQPEGASNPRFKPSPGQGK